MDFDLFRSIWNELNTNNQITEYAGRFAIQTVFNPEDNEKLLNFYLFVIPVITDPRFDIELRVPVDVKTFKYYNR